MSDTTMTPDAPSLQVEFESDIPLEIAQAAHRGTSFYPETRANQERLDYAGTLARDLTALTALADTPEKQVRLKDEFARYRDGYRARTLAELSAKARCVSTMIAGPANFPVNRMRKRSDTADKRRQDCLEYRTRALDAIKKVLQPELRPIMSGDVDAVERLKAKIAATEAEQAKMKVANAAIRKAKKGGPAAQVVALLALGYTETLAAQIVAPDAFGNVGYPPYEITNGGANLRRLRQRLEGLERLKAQPATETQASASGVRAEYAPAENRIRLYFQGKPSEEVRSNLKSRGYRWAPNRGAWSAYFTPNAKALAEEFTR